METRMKHTVLEVYYDDGLDLGKMLDDGVDFDDLKNTGVGFTYADYELCFTGEHGIVHTLDDFISFGGEMDIDPDVNRTDYQTHNDRLKKERQNISRKKIEEAHKDYMSFKRKYVEENGIIEDTEDE